MANKQVIIERAKHDRKALMTEVFQHFALIRSSLFRSLNLVEVEHRLEKLTGIFGDYTEKHALVAIETDKKDRGDIERLYLEVEKVYRETAQGYERRIDALTQDMQRHARKWLPKPATATTTTTRTDTTTTPMDTSEPPEQSQPSTSVAGAVRARTPGPSCSKAISIWQWRERNSSQRTTVSATVVPQTDLRHRLTNGERRVQRIPRRKRGGPMQCNFCKGPHPMFACEEFLSIKEIEKRRAEVKKRKLCHNCLLTGHDTKRCRKGPCERCHRYHNSVLCKHAYY